jgi:hypothetical protein
MLMAAEDTRTESRPASFRWKAFGIHLGLSLTVLGVLLYILFYYWFPGYLFDTDGGWQALRVIAGVDIILGPLLTLIAASPKKSARELRNDFTVIGVIQVCALTAGTWLAWDNRPYAMLWYDGMVYSLPWSALKDEQSALAGIERAGDNAVPRRVVVDLPWDPLVRASAISAAKDAKLTPLLDGRRYAEWPEKAAVTRLFSDISIEMAGEDAGNLRSRLEAARATHANAVLVPVSSRYAAYFLIMNASDGEILDTVAVRPAEKMLSGGYPSRYMPALKEADSAP